MKKTHFIIILFILGSLVPVSADDFQITLQEFLESTIKNNGFFVSSRHNINAAKARTRYSMSGDEITVSIRPYAGIYEKPDTDPSYLETINYKERGVDLLLSRSFWDTGTTLQLRASSIHSRTKLNDIASGLNSIEREYETRYTASFIQPLLQNRMGTLYRMEHEIAEYELKIANLRENEEREAFLCRTAAVFIEWAAIKEIQATAYQRRRLSEELYKTANQMRSQNAISQAELLQVQNELEASRALCMEMDKNDYLLIRQAAVISHIDNINRKGPEYSLTEIHVLPHSRDINNSRILQMIEYSRKSTERALRGYRNMKLPQFDLVLSATAKNEENTFSKSAEPSERELYAGVEFSYPIGSNKASGRIREAESMLHKIKAEYMTAKIEILSAIESIREEYKKAVEIIVLINRQLDAAEKRAESERIRFKKGSGSIFMYLAARQDAEGLQMQLWEKRAGLHKIYFEYMNVTDNLLEKYSGVTVR